MATTSVAKSPNYTGFATYFISSSTAVGNCGISADLLPDVLKVGLNLNSNNGASLYAKGANCGRWVEFKLGKFKIFSDKFRKTMCWKQFAIMLRRIIID